MTRPDEENDDDEAAESAVGRIIAAAGESSLVSIESGGVAMPVTDEPSPETSLSAWGR